MNYKLTEAEQQAETPKKLPYNLREKREKDAAYRTMIRAELADELYQKIVDIVIVKKKYKDPNFSSKDLAKMLGERISYQGRLAFVGRQEECQQECGRNQRDGRLCQPSVVLCGILSHCRRNSERIP